jgi:hypothetical protein
MLNNGDTKDIDKIFEWWDKYYQIVDGTKDKNFPPQLKMALLSRVKMPKYLQWFRKYVVEKDGE